MRCQIMLQDLKNVWFDYKSQSYYQRETYSDFFVFFLFFLIWQYKDTYYPYCKLKSILKIQRKKCFFLVDKCFKYDLEKVKINHFYKAKLPLSLLKIIIVLTWKSFSFYKFAPCSKDEEDEIEWVRKTYLRKWQEILMHWMSLSIHKPNLSSLKRQNQAQSSITKC